MEGESSGHGSRRSTRAQAAPDWTSTETLTLITEISAFDNDCGASVASFQKWKTVSKAISAAGIRRSLDQCRRKWAELLEVYNKVKEFGSFWALDDEVRAEIRVTEDFDLDVFRAMDEYLKGDGDGERESGGEDGGYEGAAYRNGADGLIDDYEEESGFEKQKNHSTARKRKCTARYSPEIVNKQQKLSERAKKRGRPRLAPTLKTEEVDEEMNLLNEQKILLATNHHEEEEEEEEELDEGQVLAQKLLEHVKSIEVIATRTPNESDDPLSADSNDSETDFVREQGDQLIKYLGKLAQTVRQLCDSPLMFSGSV